MSTIAKAIEAKQRKHQVVAVRSGDTVKVHQKIKEGDKERVQIFQGMVIRTDRRDSLTSSITVRRIASGVGVEKTFILHSPNVLKIEVTKRSKVRRNYLSYMRRRSGKSTRLSGIDFDREAVNTISDKAAEAELEQIKEEQAEQHQGLEAAAEAKEAKAEKPAAEPAEQ